MAETRYGGRKTRVGVVVGDGLQKMAALCATTFIGKGKADEFACDRCTRRTALGDLEPEPPEAVE